MSLFVNTNTTQQPSAGSSIFGSTSTNPNPLQPQPTQPSLFGSTTTSNPANTGSTLFGSTNTNTTGTTGSGGLFGSTTVNPTNTGSSLFGNPPNPTATGPSLFSNTASTGNAPNSNTQNPLFGAVGTSNTNTGSGLFGNTNTTAAGNAGGGGLFGNPATNTGSTSGGLFGSTNTQQQASNTGTTSGNLFGNTTGLFGNSKPATGTGPFGSTTNNPLFGGQQQQQRPQTQQQQQQQQQPSLFGSTTGSTLFGGGNKSTLGVPAQSGTGLTTSTLGAPSNLLVPKTGTVLQQQPADAQAQFQKLAQSIEAIYQAWNPQSKDCRFQYPFYNLVDPKQVSLYGRPPSASNDALWEKAVKENPDASCLVPVVAIGFDDLRTRVDAQTTQSASHLQKLKDIQTRLDALRTHHSVSNTSRLMRAATFQTQLVQRVMQLAQHLHTLIPSIRSSALRPEDEALRTKLEELEDEIRRGRIKERLNELWAFIGTIGAGADRTSAGGFGSTSSDGGWAVVDDEGLAQIVQILAEQQAGLQHLTKVLLKDQQDLGVILGSKGSISTEDAHLPEGGGENFWTSTSTLRASSLR